MELELRGVYIVQKVVKPTSSEVLDSVLVGDVLEFTLEVNQVDNKPRIKVTNRNAGISAYKTLGNLARCVSGLEMRKYRGGK